MTRLLALALVCAAAGARAAPVTLRLATVAPDGSGWAREFRSFAREVERLTNGRVHLKPYFNAVAGDEIEMAERVKRGQLDGMVSGGLICQQVAPSMNVLRVPGLFQSRSEANSVVYGMQATFETEARERGYEYLGDAPLGAQVLFAKKPVRSMAELKQRRTWRWKADEVAIALDRECGLTIIPTELREAAALLDRDQVDAMWAIPVAAVVFEWTLRAAYLLDLPHSYQFGCVLVTSRALAEVSAEDRKRMLGAAARMRERVEAETARTEAALFGGALQHQGVTVIEPSETFRAEFFAAAVEARRRIGARLVPQALLDHVLGLLSDYRAEHPAR